MTESLESFDEPLKETRSALFLEIEKYVPDLMLACFRGELAPVLFALFLSFVNSHLVWPPFYRMEEWQDWYLLLFEIVLRFRSTEGQISFAGAPLLVRVTR